MRASYEVAMRRIALAGGETPPGLPLGTATPAQLRETMASCYHHLYGLVATPPELATGATLELGDLQALLSRLEYEFGQRQLYRMFRAQSEALLAEVGRLRHRQLPDFAPLAALRGQAHALLATFRAEWPDNSEGAADPGPEVEADAGRPPTLTADRFGELVAQAEGVPAALAAGGPPGRAANPGRALGGLPGAGSGRGAGRAQCLAAGQAGGSPGLSGSLPSG